MSSIIKKYQMRERKTYIKNQTESTLKNYDAVRRQIDHLDKFVDLDHAKIVIPLCEMIETRAELDEVMSKRASNSKLDEAQELGFLLDAQVTTLRHNVEDVLSQGIEFLRLPEFDEVLQEEDEDEPEA
ncbi:MAG: hypothetical protein IKC11_00050 [Clostridia bacterium]|nr:hypothetical protein [Clostridia bacterium]